MIYLILDERAELVHNFEALDPSRGGARFQLDKTREINGANQLKFLGLRASTTNKRPSVGDGFV